MVLDCDCRFLYALRIHFALYPETAIHQVRDLLHPDLLHPDTLAVLRD
jgi:hypothetical protein